MNRFLILSVSDPDWPGIVSSAHQYDFYHTQAYSILEIENEPVLCVAFCGNDFMAMPLVIRKIEGTDLFDCTSVYGYCGPVSNLPYESISEDHISFFRSELLKFFKSRHIISAFSRLHPFMNQSLILNDFGIIREINMTVAIALRLPGNQQERGYRKDHYYGIKKLKSNGYNVIEGSTKEEIDSFIDIYYDSMTRFNADPSFFFRNEYFYRFLNNPEFKTKLLLAKKDNVITAGAIFGLTDKIMQYHLSGTKFEYRKDAPMKIILDQARLIGNDCNMDFLHLGGGFSGSSDDSLFLFKAGFSDRRFIFSVWQLIVDEEKYSWLIDRTDTGHLRTANYFPVYRAKLS